MRWRILIVFVFASNVPVTIVCLWMSFSLMSLSDAEVLSTKAIIVMQSENTGVDNLASNVSEV